MCVCVCVCVCGNMYSYESLPKAEAMFIISEIVTVCVYLWSEVNKWVFIPPTLWHCMHCSFVYITGLFTSLPCLHHHIVYIGLLHCLHTQIPLLRHSHQRDLSVLQCRLRQEGHHQVSEVVTTSWRLTASDDTVIRLGSRVGWGSNNH